MREMCIPCAAELAATMNVKKITQNKDKITCAECGRRRYGAKYEVSQKGEKGDGDDSLPR